MHGVVAFSFSIDDFSLHLLLLLSFRGANHFKFCRIIDVFFKEIISLHKNHPVLYWYLFHIYLQYGSFSKPKHDFYPKKNFAKNKAVV